MRNITTFDTRAPYIFLPILVTAADGVCREFDAILDTGAPRTEFSDTALVYAGLLPQADGITIPAGLQTQKHSRVTLPALRVCGHDIADLDIFVSRFEQSWGIDALIGLDFLRRFRIEIDFSTGHLCTEPLQIGAKPTRASGQA